MPSVYNTQRMLIVTLPSQRQPQAEWDFVLCDSRTRIVQAGQAQAALLPKSDREVVGVIPWQQLSWHQVQVPSKIKRLLVSRNASTPSFLSTGTQNASKSQTLMQGLLEEQTLQDIGQLHWIAKAAEPGSSEPQALPRAQPVFQNDDQSMSEPTPNKSNTLWVACCDKNWLRLTLHTLESTGLVVQRLVPEFEPLKLGPPKWYCMNTSGELSIVMCTQSSVAGFDRETLLAMSAFHGRSGLGQAERAWYDPKAAQVFATPESIAASSGLLGLTPELQTKAQRLVLASLSEWDFAQGEWAQGPARRWWRSMKKSWNVFWYAQEYQWAKWGLISVLGLQLLALNAWSWHQSRVIQHKTLAMKSIYMSTFPSATVVIDPKLQMTRELERLRQNKGLASPGDFEALLSVLGLLSNTLGSEGGPDGKASLGQIRNLRYTDQQLHVVFANDQPMPLMPSLPANVAAQGYQIKQTDPHSHEWVLSWRSAP